MNLISINTKQKTFVILFFCSLLIGIKLGTLIPLLSLILESKGYSNLEIGINTIAQPLATVLFVRITPKIIHRFGLTKSLVVSQLIAIVLYFSFLFVEGLTAWFIIRFIIGFAGALAWNAFDTWMLTLADDTNRGKVVATYNMVFAIGFAIGPAVIGLTGLEGSLPFITIALISFIVIIPMLTLRVEAPELSEHRPIPVLLAVIAAPTIFGAAILMGLEDVMFVSFFPIYLIKSGFGYDTALNYVTISLAGGVLAQPLIGYLLDKYNKRNILNSLVVIVFISPIILHYSLDNFIITVISLVAWGASGAGLFATGLTMLGERYETSQVASATAVFVMVFEVGSVSGPLIGGKVMDIQGPSGFILTISVLTFLFLMVSLYRTIRK